MRSSRRLYLAPSAISISAESRRFNAANHGHTRAGACKLTREKGGKKAMQRRGVHRHVGDIKLKSNIGTEV